MFTELGLGRKKITFSHAHNVRSTMSEAHTHSITVSII